ncbi:hypothetical protein V1525DRAFT_408832 [Lipomyces kononenkoae]|uniref:Uncharacterized protein n=1 Tax=Lipomyces kononenkoae TaxID=34357 RepID=A0ACC3SW30_LIPKO
MQMQQHQYHAPVAATRYPRQGEPGYPAAAGPEYYYYPPSHAVSPVPFQAYYSEPPQLQQQGSQYSSTAMADVRRFQPHPPPPPLPPAPAPQHQFGGMPYTATPAPPQASAGVALPPSSSSAHLPPALHHSLIPRVAAPVLRNPHGSYRDGDSDGRWELPPILIDDDQDESSQSRLRGGPQRWPSLLGPTREPLLHRASTESPGPYGSRSSSGNGNNNNNNNTVQQQPGPPMSFDCAARAYGRGSY